jgi:hypothetical protein
MRPLVVQIEAALLLCQAQIYSSKVNTDTNPHTGTSSDPRSHTLRIRPEGITISCNEVNSCTPVVRCVAEFSFSGDDPRRIGPPFGPGEFDPIWHGYFPQTVQSCYISSYYVLIVIIVDADYR